MGDPCSTSRECDFELVCVLLDPAKPDEGAVCVPFVAPADPACDDVPDCRDKGFPLEGTCTDGACVCPDEVPGCPHPDLPNGGPSDGGPDGPNDAGPDSNAGT